MCHVPTMDIRLSRLEDFPRLIILLINIGMNTKTDSGISVRPIQVSLAIRGGYGIPNIS